MTNYEAYEKAILTELETGSCELYAIALAEKNKKCDNITCLECRQLTAGWLKEEYKEPNWSNVVVDTPVNVSDDGELWFCRYFAKYENGIPYTWRGGATSWSINEETNATEAWKYIKLYERKK